MKEREKEKTGRTSAFVKHIFRILKTMFSNTEQFVPQKVILNATILTDGASDLHAQKSPLAESGWYRKPRTNYLAQLLHGNSVSAPGSQFEHCPRGSSLRLMGDGERQSFVFLCHIVRVAKLV